MSKIKDRQTVKIFLFLFAFICLRGIIFAPENILFDVGWDSFKTPPSADSIVFLISVIIFSVVAAFAVTVISKKNSLAKLPLFFVIVDSVFLFLTYSFAIYILSAVSIIIFLMLISDRYISAGMIALPIFSLLCTVLSREYALSFVMILIMVGILLAFENNILRKKIVISVMAAIAALIVGVTVNTVLIKNESTNAFLEAVPYTSVLVKENHGLYKAVNHISKMGGYVLPSVIPGIAFSIAVLMFARKAGGKLKTGKVEKDNLYGMHITVLICILLSIAGALFLSEDACCLLGVVSPIAVLTVCLTEKPSGTASLVKIEQFVKKHIPVCLCGMFLIENLCYISVCRYYICNRILDLVKTIV